MDHQGQWRHGDCHNRVKLKKQVKIEISENKITNRRFLINLEEHGYRIYRLISVFVVYNRREKNHDSQRIQFVNWSSYHAKPWDHTAKKPQIRPKNLPMRWSNSHRSSSSYSLSTSTRVKSHRCVEHPLAGRSLIWMESKNKSPWKIRSTYFSARYDRWFNVPDGVFIWKLDLEMIRC